LSCSGPEQHQERGQEHQREIAFMLGFTEPTSFYRYFKRATGMTAKEYLDSTLSKKSIF